MRNTLANTFLFGFVAALLVGNTSIAYADEACDEKFEGCDEAATSLRDHKKADCGKSSECSGIADKQYDADKGTCDAAKLRCEARVAGKDALKAAKKEAREKAKTLAKVGGVSGHKGKGNKLKTPSAKPAIATAATASASAASSTAGGNCDNLDFGDPSKVGDEVRARFASARAAGEAAARRGPITPQFAD